MTRIRLALVGLYSRLLVRNLCPCAWKHSPEWAKGLCSKADDYLWQSGYWGPRMTDTKPATIVCTLSPDDKGEACRYCGHPGGSGHGKQR